MKYDVKISNVSTEGSIRAYASVNLDEKFAITGFKVIDGANGTFVAMPSIKNNKGDYKDVFFPITKESRAELMGAILDEYENTIEQLASSTQKPFTQSM